MWIFEHNFVADKEKMRRQAVARQVFFTQYAAKFAEKTRVYACEDRFLYSRRMLFFLNQRKQIIVCFDRLDTFIQQDADAVLYFFGCNVDFLVLCRNPAYFTHFCI